MVLSIAHLPPSSMLQFFHRQQLLATPWKNGGGTTCEIATVPAGSGWEQFQWRLSIATIAADGPFSSFEGVDRVITLLRGPGVRLHSADAAVDHSLDQAWQPFAFAGETALQAQLLGADCEDFNVMVRRSFGRAQVQVLQQAWALPAQGALYVLRGRWQRGAASDGGMPWQLAAQSGAYWTQLPAAGLHIEPMTPDACLLAITITPHGSEEHP